MLHLQENKPKKEKNGYKNCKSDLRHSDKIPVARPESGEGADRRPAATRGCQFENK